MQVLEQGYSMNPKMKKMLQEVVEEIRAMDYDLEDGIVLQWNYPEEPNLFFQLVMEEVPDNVLALKEKIDNKVH